MAEEIEKAPLRAIFWRDEILQVLYWMKGEGFGKEINLAQVVPLLNSNEELVTVQLDFDSLQSREFSIKLDKQIPQVPGGGFVPHVRLIKPNLSKQ